MDLLAAIPETNRSISFQFKGKFPLHFIDILVNCLFKVAPERPEFNVVCVHLRSVMRMEQGIKLCVMCSRQKLNFPFELVV